MSLFHCRQFSLDQGQCAMRLSTDALLLGAWAQLPKNAQQALDVGTGTGILSLMLAQNNPQLHLLAIDIDAQAVDAASKNFANAPWPNRLICKQLDFNDLPIETLPPHLICNPPYYPSSSNFPMQDSSRKLARQTDTLDLPALFKAFSQLPPDASLHLVLPVSEEKRCLTHTLQNVHLRRRCYIQAHAHKSPKRVLLDFRQQTGPCQDETLAIYDLQQAGPHNYTEAYRKLLNDFLIIF